MRDSSTGNFVLKQHVQKYDLLGRFLALCLEKENDEDHFYGLQKTVFAQKISSPELVKGLKRLGVIPVHHKVDSHLQFDCEMI